MLLLEKIFDMCCLDIHTYIYVHIYTYAYILKFIAEWQLFTKIEFVYVWIIQEFI